MAHVGITATAGHASPVSRDLLDTTAQSGISTTAGHALLCGNLTQSLPPLPQLPLLHEIISQESLDMIAQIRQRSGQPSTLFR
eukprot:2264375-Karenia_brevis.AAC.1